MKKIIIIMSFMVTIGVYGSFAEQGGDKSIGGIRAGFNSASMVEQGTKPDTAFSLNSFYVGFYDEKKVAPLLFLGTGIEYFQNGIKYTGESKRVLHTISIPVDLKVKLGPVFALGGLAANFKVAEKFFPGDNKGTLYENEKSNWFDVPVFLGAGIKILFISLEARYHWGLIEASNGNYNRYFQIGAAISL